MTNIFLYKILTFMRKMWKNIVQPGRPQMTVWPMRIAHWIPKSANTFPEYVILIVFPLKQWLLERTSVLGHTYIACLLVLCLRCNPLYTWNFNTIL